jgi:uracil-DNA glycosylase
MTKQQLLDELKNKEKNDPDLPLKETSANLVFGHGNPDAKIIFLGEAPGKNEDEKGLPFIGAAGKILDQLLESINLERGDIFISSVIHYRPPKNRPPKPDEIKAFSRYVDQIIEIINPKIIATLGNFSLKKFLPNTKISEVHGKAQKITVNGKETILIPLYHPAAVLYKRDLKKTLEEDFKTIRGHY